MEMNTRIIKVDISLCKPKHDPLFFYNGKITISDESIVVSGCLDNEHADIFSAAYKAAIDLHSDFARYVKYKKANEDGRPIVIKKEAETRVLSFRTSRLSIGGSEYAWSLSRLSVSYSNVSGENSVVINLPYLKLARGIGGSANLPDSIALSDNIQSFIIKKTSNENQTIINTDNLPKEKIDAFLTHASFYFYSLCDIIKSNTYNDGKQKVNIQINNFESTKDFGGLPELHYICYSEDRSFKTFFRQSRWNSLQEDQREKLKNAVYTFVRCKYCDETTEFLLLYSILDRYAGNSHGTVPYPAMKKKLAKWNIDISKIGPIVDPALQKLKLYLIKDSGKKVTVANFCDLRNFIMHFMANAIVDFFLRKCNLISNMRFAITIILLKEFGFDNISFSEDWSHLSMLLNNVE